MRVVLKMALVVLLVAGLPACAPITVAPPTPGLAHFPEFLQPTVPRDLAGSAATVSQERAWRFLQAGDLRNADREIAAALKVSPQFYPSEATAGYLNLARKDPRGALAAFDRALSHRADYPPALVGKGQALSALSRDEDAIGAFEAALKADATLTDLQRRLDVLTLRVVQRDVAAARQAARTGKYDDAMQMFRQAIERSPESGFLHRELAVIERDHGSGDAAIDQYRRATILDPTDAPSLVELAEMLEARNDFEFALKAYGDALAVAPDAAVAARRDALALRAETARLPPEYRAIGSATQITRADLAALIGVRLTALVDSGRPRDIGVVTDIRGHWAERWILIVARSGVMDLYDNHTFQPRAVVRRVDCAQALGRLLARVAVGAPVEARRWQNARGKFPDIAPSHLAYAAASVVTAAGVMTTADDGAFQPSRLVSGAEATDAIARVLAVSISGAGGSGGRRP